LRCSDVNTLETRVFHVRIRPQVTTGHGRRIDVQARDWIRRNASDLYKPPGGYAMVPRPHHVELPQHFLTVVKDLRLRASNLSVTDRRDMDADIVPFAFLERDPTKRLEPRNLNFYWLRHESLSRGDRSV